MQERSIIPALVAACFLSLVCARAVAAAGPGGVYLAGGTGGPTSLDVGPGYHLGLIWDWDQRWSPRGVWYLSGYWDVGVGYLEDDENNAHMLEGGAAAVGRYQRRAPWLGVHPFVEGGAGLHAISDDRFGGKYFSTTWQFASLLGVGISFGKGNRFEAAYRHFHLSNGNLRHPNPSLNYHLLRFVYRFRAQ